MKPLPLGWYKALIISTNDLIYFNNNDQNFYDRSPIDEEATLKLEKARAARTKKNKVVPNKKLPPMGKEKQDNKKPNLPPMFKNNATKNQPVSAEESQDESDFRVENNFNNKVSEEKREKTSILNEEDLLDKSDSRNYSDKSDDHDMQEGLTVYQIDSLKNYLNQKFKELDEFEQTKAGEALTNEIISARESIDVEIAERKFEVNSKYEDLKKMEKQEALAKLQESKKQLEQQFINRERVEKERIEATSNENDNLLSLQLEEKKQQKEELEMEKRIMEQEVISDDYEELQEARSMLSEKHQMDLKNLENEYENKFQDFKLEEDNKIEEFKRSKRDFYLSNREKIEKEQKSSYAKILEDYRETQEATVETDKQIIMREFESRYKNDLETYRNSILKEKESKERLITDEMHKLEEEYYEDVSEIRREVNNLTATSDKEIKLKFQGSIQQYDKLKVTVNSEIAEVVSRVVNKIKDILSSSQMDAVSIECEMESLIIEKIDEIFSENQSKRASLKIIERNLIIKQVYIKYISEIATEIVKHFKEKSTNCDSYEILKDKIHETEKRFRGYYHDMKEITLMTALERSLLEEEPIKPNPVKQVTAGFASFSAKQNNTRYEEKHQEVEITIDKIAESLNDANRSSFLFVASYVNNEQFEIDKEKTEIQEMKVIT